MTLEYIQNVAFTKAAFSGYKPQEVDAFIDQVYLAFKRLTEENEALKRKLNNSLEEK